MSTTEDSTMDEINNVTIVVRRTASKDASEAELEQVERLCAALEAVLGDRPLFVLSSDGKHLYTPLGEDE